jgi:hypothetical protein
MNPFLPAQLTVLENFTSDLTHENETAPVVLEKLE